MNSVPRDVVFPIATAPPVLNDHSHLSEAGKKLLEEACEILEAHATPTGSRLISPGHVTAESDFDYVVYAPKFYELPDIEWGCQAVCSQHTTLEKLGWMSQNIYTRNGCSLTNYADGQKINLIVVTDLDEHERWLQASEIGPKLGLTTRDQRIALFRGIIGDH